MILYDESKSKTSFKTNKKIGGGVYGKVYRTSKEECLKVYKDGESVNKEILEFIKSLNLKNYYKIYNFYNNRRGIFKAHTMRYYEKEEVDILTMPTEYTIDNLLGIKSSVETLTQNNILISDTHSSNIIMNSNNITIIDTDLYTFNDYYPECVLEHKNIKSLEYLFKNIFYEAISKYNNEYDIKKL